MTSEKLDIAENNKSENEPRFFTLKLLITVALAFGAALLFRRSAGILAMFPIAFLLCGVSAFIDIKNIIKAFIFGVTVFCLNTVENDEINIAIIFSALCMIAVFAFGYAVEKIKKGKKHAFAVAAAGAVLCVALSFVFVGNPFAAMGANEKIKEYTEANYPETKNAALGTFEFTNIYYNYRTGAYAVDAVSSEYPTEGATVSVGGDIIRDGFKRVMSEKISEPYVSDMAAVLREAFPDGSFTVEFDGFVAMPDETILSAKSGALEDNVRYEIFVGGIQSGEAMAKEVAKLVNALDRSGIGYAKITFKSGIGIWHERCVTVDPNHPECRFLPEIDYYSTVGTNRFSEYIQKAILDKE